MLTQQFYSWEFIFISPGVSPGDEGENNCSEYLQQGHPRAEHHKEASPAL